MSQRISTLPGVAQVQINGPQKYAVRIQLDPSALAARKIGIDEVAEACRPPTSICRPARSTAPNARSTSKRRPTVQRAGYRTLTIAYRNGAPVHLDDVGVVIDCVETDKAAAWIGESISRGIVLAVQRQPGANTIGVVDSVQDTAAGAARQMPAGLSLDVVYDRSQTVRASVHDVKFTLGCRWCSSCS